MFHRTTRLFLRPAWPEDWEAVFAGVADEQVVMNLSRVPWPYKPDHARWFVERALDRCHPTLLITQADSGLVVGAASLVERDGGAEVGYWIGRPHWGQGYATEATQGLIEIARLLGFQQLSGRHFVDNPASGRVLRKVGFRPTGRVTTLHSVARGKGAPALEYALELNGDAAEPQKQAA